MSLGIGINLKIKGRFLGGLTPPPLLLDTYPNAVAAYSVRKLRTEYAGNCMLVRRDSDNSEHNIGFVDDFVDTATLLSLATAEVNTYESDFSVDLDSFSEDDTSSTAGVTNDGEEDCLEVELINGNQVHQLQRALTLNASKAYRVTLDYYIEVGADIGALRVTGSPLPSVQPQGEWISYDSGDFDAASTTMQIRILNSSLGNFINDDGAKLWIKNVIVTRLNSDISVVRWFNQIIGGGYAEQASAALQPLVAKDGVLVLSGSKLALEYNATDTTMAMSTEVELADAFYNVFVCDIGQTAVNTSCTMTGRTSSSDRLSIFNNIWRHKISNTNYNINTSGLRNGRSLLSSLRDGDNSIKAFLNGASLGVVTAAGTTAMQSVGPDVAANSLDGVIQEFIVFSDDKTAAQPAIELNINAYYEIY